MGGLLRNWLTSSLKVCTIFVPILYQMEQIVVKRWIWPFSVCCREIWAPGTIPRSKF